jgi:acyl-CoA thioesterase FadM
MILGFRVIWSILKSIGRSRNPAMDDYTAHFRVLPTDTEFSALNAARYISLMEVGVLECNIRNGFISLALKKGWTAIVCAQSIEYLRSVRRFEKFSITTSLLGWDDRYFYRRYTVRKGEKVCALSYQRIMVRSRKGLIVPSEVMQGIGHSGLSPEVTESIKARVPFKESAA